MNKEKYYRYLFLIGAIWNWTIAILLLIVSLFMLDFACSVFGMAKPPSLIWFHTIVGLIFVFGVGYYLVAKDLQKNRGIVVVGIMEKFFFFIILLIYFLIGDINLYGFSLIIGDFIFGCFFLNFLVNYHKK